MKRLARGWFLFLFFSVTARAQSSVSTGSNQYLEGARLVVDILQLFKKELPGRPNKSPESVSKNCNCCFYNSDSLRSIKVTLITKFQPVADTVILQIRQRERECGLQIGCGIYHCRVETDAGLVLSRGDIRINEKEVLFTK